MVCNVPGIIYHGPAGPKIVAVKFCSLTTTHLTFTLSKVHLVNSRHLFLNEESTQWKFVLDLG